MRHQAPRHVLFAALHGLRQLLYRMDILQRSLQEFYVQDYQYPVNHHLLHPAGQGHQI